MSEKKLYNIRVTVTKDGESFVSTFGSYQDPDSKIKNDGVHLIVNGNEFPLDAGVEVYEYIPEPPSEDEA